MEETLLTTDTITFGKYKNKTISDILKDRSYCSWLLDQDWFQKNYEYLFNRVKEYDPKIYFLNPIEEEGNFIDIYIYFNLANVETLNLELTEKEKTCYSYYLKMISELKQKIQERIEEGKPNAFDIKAPVNWLKRFERETRLTREDFKSFLNSYELPNIPYIVKDIKKEGGINYLGCDSFNIAKKKSSEQEAWWEGILNSKYGEDLGSQFKFENCIFDFTLINSNIIFEVKLGIKDFDKKQYEKYIKTLNKYNIIYLIDRDCIINMSQRKIYTTDIIKYQTVVHKLSTSNRLAEIISNYEFVEIDNIQNSIKLQSQG